MQTMTSRAPRQYTCGTLTYTKVTLIMLFFWLLLGMMSYVTAAGIIQAVLPIQLKHQGATDNSIGVIMYTINSIFNVTVCPYVSFKSDRCRSKWGRRIFYIITTLPFMTAAFLLFAFSADLGNFFQAHFSFLAATAPSTVTLFFLAVAMVIYQFFEMFVGSVIWYIFNDVVPQQFLARINAMNQLVTAGALALFNHYLFQYSEAYFREIFIGVAILYSIGVGLMCFMVKEGQYAPISESISSHTTGQKSHNLFGKIYNGVIGLMSFFYESFSHPFYGIRYGMTACMTVAAMGLGTYGTFFYQAMGLDLTGIGKMNAICGIVPLILVYFVAQFIDRWHPVRVSLYANIFLLLTPLALWKWVFVTLPATQFWVITLLTLLFSLFLLLLQGGANLPMEMMTFPKSRFGQFCSAQAMVRSATTGIIGGTAVGMFFDLFRVAGDEFVHYRYVFLWTVLWTIPVVILTYILYRKWGHLGGVKKYHAPAKWSETGYEEMPAPETTAPSSRYLKIAVVLFDCNCIVLLLGSIGFYFYAIKRGAAGCAGNFLLWTVPAAIVYLLVWALVRFLLLRDIRRVKTGKKPLNGIPHHGVLIVVGVKHVMLTGLAVYQTWLAVDWAVVQISGQNLSEPISNMTTGAPLLWLCEITTGIVLAFLFYLVCRMERGFSEELDTPSSLDDNNILRSVFVRKEKA